MLPYISHQVRIINKSNSSHAHLIFLLGSMYSCKYQRTAQLIEVSLKYFCECEIVIARDLTLFSNMFEPCSRRLYETIWGYREVVIYTKY